LKIGHDSAQLQAAESFKDALQIYSTRLEGHEFDRKHSKDMGIPVFKMVVSHDEQNAEVPAKADTQGAVTYSNISPSEFNDNDNDRVHVARLSLPRTPELRLA
jgi:hypothetical protein